MDTSVSNSCQNLARKNASIKIHTTQEDFFRVTKLKVRAYLKSIKSIVHDNIIIRCFTENVEQS